MYVLHFGLIYQFLTIPYLILLCGDVESNPGPDLQHLETSEDYEKYKAKANLYPCFVYTNIRRANNKHKKISDFFAAAEHTNTIDCYWNIDKQ